MKNNGANDLVAEVGRRGKSRTRYVAAIAVGISLIMCLFPPWRMDLPGEVYQGLSVARGYHFILNAPHPLAHIDLAKLVVQILVLVIASMGAVIALRWKRGN